MPTAPLQPDDALRRLLLAASVGPRQILNAPEACAWLGFNRPGNEAKKFMDSLKPAGLHNVKVGKHARWRVSDLTAYVESLTEAEAAESPRKPRIAT